MSWRRRRGLPPFFTWLAWVFGFIVCVIMGGVAGFVAGVAIFAAWGAIDIMCTQRQ
jgi:hypothetical protein